MYHGTSADAAARIQQSGFIPSPSGMLGRGVYLSRDLEKAKVYSKGASPVVLKCRVKVGRVKKIHRQGHPMQTTWHDNGFDSAWLPPNNTMVGTGRTETCVFSPD